MTLLSVFWVVGCANPRYISSRSVRENPLAQTLQLVSRSGPQLSERTGNVLRRFALSDVYRDNCTTCFQKIRRLHAEDPDPELIYALAELSYVEGKRAERAGQTADALNNYGISLTASYDYLFGPQTAETRNPYDPQFRDACNLYNQSLEDTLRLLCSEHQIKPGHSYTIETPGKKFVIQTKMRGNWKPDEFDHYEFVSDYSIKTLNNRHTSYGLGVPLIAVRKGPAAYDEREKYYPEGLSYSVTAMLRCVPPPSGIDANGKPLHPRQPSDERICVLEFFDPLVANQVELADTWVPLETDLTTPLAFYLDSPEFRQRDNATEGLLNPNRLDDKRGLYMLEPYDPDRIPVLMVHGLWSSPLTWMDMFNDLRSFPEIRDRYQFWFYLFPSGQPFWISATQLRNDLATMRQAFDPSHRDKAVDEMVLVGHSMGGLVSRMQTIESGDDFWRIVSDEPIKSPEKALANIRGPDDDRYRLVSTLFFRPNQSIKRVVTIATPHRGSEFANELTRWAARKIIRLPKMAVRTGYSLLTENPRLFKDSDLLTTANAIDSLAPESPIFPVMMRAKRSADVKYHNIIGVLSNPSLIAGAAGRGDGIVQYDSAVMDDVESELVIDADHTSIHMTSKAIFEVRRILREHLVDIDSRDRVASRSEISPAPATPEIRRSLR